MNIPIHYIILKRCGGINVIHSRLPVKEYRYIYIIILPGLLRDKIIVYNIKCDTMCRLMT